MKKIVIYVVVFDPIKILVGWAHQNDCQNLSFVKAINVGGKKMVLKWSTHSLVIFISDQSFKSY